MAKHNVVQIAFYGAEGKFEGMYHIYDTKRKFENKINTFKDLYAKYAERVQVIGESNDVLALDLAADELAALEQKLASERKVLMALVRQELSTARVTRECMILLRDGTFRPLAEVEEEKMSTISWHAHAVRLYLFSPGELAAEELELIASAI